MQNTLSISVVMAVKNCEQFVEQAISSILGQTFCDFEFLIVNDGSSDRTAEILDEFKQLDDRVIVFSRKSQGLTSSLNFLLDQSRGKFIARMDGDDVADPNRLEKQLQFFKNNPDIVACGTQIERINENGDRLSTPALPLVHESIENDLWSGNGMAICHPSLMVRAHAIRQIGGYCEDFVTSQDIDIYLRLAELGRIGNTSDVLLQYRQHAGSVNSCRINQQNHDIKSILHRALRRRGNRRPANFMLTRWRHSRAAVVDRLLRGDHRSASRLAFGMIAVDILNMRNWLTILLCCLPRSCVAILGYSGRKR